MSKLNRENDPLGEALLAYQRGEQNAKMEVISDQGDKDYYQASYFFRNFAEMPEIERIALDKCFGRVLDVGAGAGMHSRYLQEKGFDVKAIDISPGSVDVMRSNGILNSECIDFFEVESKFDTILLLMNGMGISGTVVGIHLLLQKAQEILNPFGQILFDSSDIRHLFDPNLLVVKPNDVYAYFGEITFQMKFKKTRGPKFDWIYIDPELMSEIAEEEGWHFEIIQNGEEGHYLGRLTRIRS